MDDDRARELLAGERRRLQQMREEASANLAGVVEMGEQEWSDASETEVDEQTNRALGGLADERWEALVRAEERLAAGRYGRSVRSGEPIPDERLEADPLAELTVAEAEAEGTRQLG